MKLKTTNYNTFCNQAPAGTILSGRTLRALFCIGIIFCANSFRTGAQELSAIASAKEKDYVVGDVINVNLMVKRPENYSVSWKRQNPDPKKLELVDSIVKDSARENGFEKIDILLPYAGYDSGIAVYPAQVFVFHKQGDTARFVLKTQPIVLHISSITVDLKKDPKPIVAPLEPGWDWYTIIRYGAGILVLLIMIVVAYTYWKIHRKRPDNPTAEYPELKRPAWELAIEKLAQLQKDDLPAKGHVKEFYVSLSHILKEFVSESLDIDGLELTTEELADALQD